MPRLHVRDLGHVNLLTEDYLGSMRHVREVFGADFFASMYEPGVRSTNNLFLIGSTCFEFFAPWDRESVLGRSLDRRGPGWFALEWRVEDLDAALAEVRARGIRVTSEAAGSYAWLHPGDCGGLLVELTAGTFPTDPRDVEGFSDQRWREHPLGIVGLASVDVAVADAGRTAGILVELLVGERVAVAPADPAAAYVEAVRVAGDTYRFLSPPGTARRGPTSTSAGPASAR